MTSIDWPVHNVQSDEWLIFFLITGLAFAFLAFLLLLTARRSGGAGSTSALRGAPVQLLGTRREQKKLRRLVLPENWKGVESPDAWSAHFISTSGLKSSGVPNQDAYSFTTLQCGWILCIACDGHGEHGEIIAERVSRALPLFFSSYLVHGTEEALRRAFQSAQNDLESSFGPMQVYSGATVVMCCIDKDAESVWCAHVGDSRLVVGDMDTGQPVFCSIEHKAHDAEEYKRLEAAGAQVIQKRYDDGEVVSRIFIPKTGVPGLAMSRSMGDGCLKKYGVTAEPDISNITDSWKSCALPGMIMGSDGLWDTVSPEEACSTISARYRSKRDVQAGLENLTRRSQRRWIEAEGDYCDDVTVAFVAPLAAEAAA